MQKLQNDTLQRFLDYFIEELKRTNEDRKLYDIKEFDIPFIISSLSIVNMYLMEKEHLMKLSNLLVLDFLLYF